MATRKRPPKHSQTSLTFRTHGGARPGAGRPSKHGRAGASHATRSAHDHHHPVHITLRVVGSVGNLRRRDTYLAIREATIITARREDFRIIHMSIQRDHVHLLVEADDKHAISNGVRGFSISAARQINKAISARPGGDYERRTGRVFADRYHARPLTTPRAVRSCLRYFRVNRPISRVRASTSKQSRQACHSPVLLRLDLAAQES